MCPGHMRAKPLIEAAGGRYLTRSGEHKVFEGKWHPVRLVLVEFPSQEAAESFYNSNDYQEAKAIRLRCSETDMVVVQGIE